MNGKKLFEFFIVSIKAFCKFLFFDAFTMIKMQNYYSLLNEYFCEKKAKKVN